LMKVFILARVRPRRALCI